MKPLEALALISGKVDQELLLRNEYLAAENEFLRSKLPARVPLHDDERRRLAELGHRLGKEALADVAAIVKPETLLAWYRRLIAAKFDGTASRRRAGGRSLLEPDLEELVLRLARENPTWGYDRITGALHNLGHDLSDETVGNVLRRHGIPPAPGRQPKVTWADFIATHADTLVAADFFTAEVFTPMGLLTVFVLFFIHVGSREVHIAGITPHPDEAWMDQTARELTMADWGFLHTHRCSHLILDRDTKFGGTFRGILTKAGIKVLRLPPRSPNLNAFAERFVRTVKEECLSRLLLFGVPSLRRALDEFVSHYHEERNHQGLGNALLFPNALSPMAPTVSNSPPFSSSSASATSIERQPEPAILAVEDPPEPVSLGPVLCKERLGGLLRDYYRSAG
jgi:hypothetical protein